MTNSSPAVRADILQALEAGPQVTSGLNSALPDWAPGTISNELGLLVASRKIKRFPAAGMGRQYVYALR